MPNQLRQTNNEYGSFCGYASERARAFFGDLPTPSEAQLLLEGEKVGVVVPEDYPQYMADDYLRRWESSMDRYRVRGRGRQAYNGSDVVMVSISDGEFRHYAQEYYVMRPISWDCNESIRGTVYTITYPDATVLQVNDCPALPAGMIYTARATMPCNRELVTSMRHIARNNRGEVRYQHQTEPRYIYDRHEFDMVARPSVDIWQLLFREYELPRNFPSEHNTFAILIGT